MSLIFLATPRCGARGSPRSLEITTPRFCFCVDRAPREVRLGSGFIATSIWSRCATFGHSGNLSVLVRESRFRRATRVITATLNFLFLGAVLGAQQDAGAGRDWPA